MDCERSKKKKKKKKKQQGQFSLTSFTSLPLVLNAERLA